MLGNVNTMKWATNFTIITTHTRFGCLCSLQHPYTPYFIATVAN